MAKTKLTLTIISVLISAGMNAQKYHDAKIYNIKGNVRYVWTASDVLSEGACFSPEGKIIAVNLLGDEWKLVDTKHDEQGILKQMWDPAEPLLYGIAVSFYDYDASGKMYKETSKADDKIMYEKSFDYDNNGQISKEEYSDPDIGENYSWSFTYLSFDSKGNWTERTAKTMPEEMTTNNQRTISYWEDDASSGPRRYFDAAMFQMNGNVKSLEETTSPNGATTHTFFAANGECYYSDCPISDSLFIRSNGYITVQKYNNIEIRYGYDGQGRMKQIASPNCIQDFLYDSKGSVTEVNINTIIPNEGVEQSIKLICEDTGYDPHGNWTYRTITNPTTGQMNTISRKITYWNN